MHITFRTVDNTEIGKAFEWHRAFADGHEAIYPRDSNTFANLVYDRSVWCAVTSDDRLQALSYAAFSSADHAWEIGGLMVSDAMRGKGLGRIMMRLPLIDTLVLQQPLDWDPKPQIVAHVLASNDAPRRIIPAVGFRYAYPVEIPADALPGLKADDDGVIRGDEFHLDVPAGLVGLADWCDGWTGKLLDGTEASVDLLDGLTTADWSTMLREMAAKHETDAGNPP